MTKRTRGPVVCLISAMVVMAMLAAASCTGDDDSSDGSAAKVSNGGYRATIERTTDGVPHVTADDGASLSFGQGYASFEDHSCDLADQIVKVSSRRAEFFGAGDDDKNIDSDFAWKAIGVTDLAARDWPKQKGDARSMVIGFVDGWNSALDEIGAEGIKGWCAGKPWVVPITAEQLYAYMRSITVQASSGALAAYIGTAAPPGEAPVAAPVSFTSPSAQPLLGSNGWAIGSDRTENGEGILLANPHFPWEGALRFWEVQLTVPGELDVYGAQLSGVPGVGIGFTQHVAWTHTVSAGHRFTAYKLSLVPGKPTSYLYDGAERAMTSRSETVQVLGPDGALTPTQRTLWFSHYGPILEFPGVGWTESETITFRDANIDDDEFLNQYLVMDRAESMKDLQAAHREYNGVPLFNTIAVDDKGTAWYADTSATPNLSDEAIAAWEAAEAVDGSITDVAENNGAVLLDGSTSRDEWVVVDGARDPGLVPFDDQPQVEREDYLFNANDSFWLPNAQHVLEGDYSPMHGEQKTERSWRTRENAFVLDDITEAGPSGADGKFSLAEVTDAALLDEAGTARVLRDEVSKLCSVVPVVDVDGESVDLNAACTQLASWDGHYDLDSKGAVLWREFWMSAGGLEFATPFDPAKPVETPAGIKDPNAAAAKLGRAVVTLRNAGQPIDVTLGALQHDGRVEAGADRTALHGGFDAEGLTNALGYSTSNTTLEPRPERPPTVNDRSRLTADGYWINNGTSFLMAVSFGKDGPTARSILSYGQTQDRTSPLFTSQTKRFADKDWKKVAFTEAQIQDQQVGKDLVVTGKRSG